MSFDVSLVREADHTRVAVRGESKLGRLLSLLQVLELDSTSWPGEAVLLDLRDLQTRLTPEEQARLGWEAARALRRMKKIAILAPTGRMRESAGLRLFEREEDALRWFGEG